MEVSSSTDNITHAVISNKTAVNLSVATSAEFFNILSSSLYTDQILAVVRETICNAWDAHIEAGITNKPIEITLTENEFVIRDYGNGIPKDEFADIYGVYGKSTKKQNAEVTGGFGLGCKSPFAYTDNFEVTSWNQKIKTIYSLSKSSAVVGGLSAITEIVSIPTDDSGLKVRMTIKPSDRYLFNKKIKSVIYDGGINATINDVEADTIYTDKLKDKFIILMNNTTGISIKYGNVLYDISSKDDYINEYATAKNILKKIYSYNENKLILLAPPNSLAIAPSRESISLQEKSISTIKQLLNDFSKTIQNKLDKLDNSQIINIFKNTLNIDSVKSALNGDYYSIKPVYKHIKSYSELLHCIVTKNCNTIYEKHYLNAIYSILLKEKLITKNAYKLFKHKGNSKSWFVKNTYNILAKHLAKCDVKFEDILFTNNGYDNSFFNTKYFNTNFLCKYIIPTFVLHTTKVIHKSRLNAVIKHNNLTANENSYLHLQIKKDNVNLQKIRNVLNKNKSIVFIDLTVKYDWEEPKVAKKTTKSKGLVKASAAFDSCNIIRLHKYKVAENSILNPDYIVKIDTSESNFLSENYEQIIKLIGDNCGLYHTIAQRNKYDRLNVPTLFKKLEEVLIDKIENSRAIKRIIANSVYDSRLIRCILDNEDIAKQFNVLFVFNKEDLNLFSVIHRFFIYSSSSRLRNYYKELQEPIYQNTKLLNLVNKLKSDKFKWIDKHSLRESLESRYDRQAAIDFIKENIK